VTTLRIVVTLLLTSRRIEGRVAHLGH